MGGGSKYQEILEQVQWEQQEQIQPRQHTEVPEIPEEHDHTYNLLTDNIGIVFTILGFALIGAIVVFKNRIKEWLK